MCIRDSVPVGHSRSANGGDARRAGWQRSAGHNGGARVAGQRGDRLRVAAASEVNPIGVQLDGLGEGDRQSLSLIHI